MGIKQVKLENLAHELKEWSGMHLEQQRYAVADGILQSLSTLIENSPVDTGLYAQSWDFTIDEKTAVLGNYAPYAPIIEVGARPFTPPITPLLAWAKRVLNNPSQPPEYDDAVWGLAKYTQNKISRVGMEPKKVLENTLPLILENIRKSLQKLQSGKKFTEVKGKQGTE